jgi:phosphate transport system substrate-binding protein
MKKILRRMVALLFTIVLLTSALTACTKNSDNNDNNNSSSDNNNNEDTDNGNNAGSEDDKDLSGNLTLAGSTSMEKLANAAAEAFMIKFPDVLVSPEFTGSSAGIEAVLAGTVDIGNSSRNLKDTEISAGAIENIVAIDGIAVILDKANTITNLTKEQLTGIYTGTIKNWSEVGGISLPIVVVGREAGSGTRGAFEELLEIEDLCVYSNEINSTGGVMAKVKSTPGAIGYVSLDVIDDTVIAASINDIIPSEETIKAGDYILSRPFVMATKGEIGEQNEIVQAFFEYMGSEEGKELIKNVGLITVD